MKKNLQIINQNNQLMLKKSKSLLTITNNILSNDNWIQHLWDWADKNDIPDLEWIEYEESDEGGYWSGVPRKRAELIFMTKLDIQGMELAKLPDVIGNLTNLKEICLVVNNILTLPKEIGNLYNLENLDLGFNSLVRLSKDIGNLSSLLSLALYGNQLVAIPKEIGNLSNLEFFGLMGNQIKELPETIGNLTKLKLLMLSNNALSSLPDEITKLNNLETLSLESNPNLVLTDKQVIWIDSLKMKGCKVTQDEEWMRKLWKWADENDISDLEWIEKDDYEYSRGIPRNKTELLNLTDLNLSENQLTELVKEIENLINLTGLWFETNQLYKLPKEITNLKHLTHFWLSENHLSELPKEIGNLSSLTHFSLSNNKLKKIPNEIGHLLNLKELYLDENDLVELPKEIVNLMNLTKFDFEDNPNLILTEEQKEWIRELINNGCDVVMTDSFYAEYELERRYKYLDEFNVGREVPITPEMLDNDIPPRITAKLADDTFTFEEYLDEVSEYIDKEKFNNLVQRLYDRDEDLGRCFERNITFNSYEDNKLIWTSVATGEDKKMLITHWSIINNFVKEIFGSETKIANIAVSIE